MADGGPPAGWLDDPDDPTRERYWDGDAWTDHRRVRPADGDTTVPDEHSPEEPAPKFTPEEVAERQAQGEKIGKGCGYFILTSVLLVAALVAFSSDDDGGGSGGPDDIEAYVMCQQFVEDRLKAPATAGFPLSSEATITGGPSTWTVRSHVDAENSFGAQVRTQFTCRVSYQGNDRWLLDDLTME